jgi:protein O-GlcNAc transferase
MTPSGYEQWLARGHAYRAEGRPVDAMLCFRRAARGEPRAAAPHYHLGELLWQLGLIPDAISSWREASRIDPRFPAPARALAEVLLASGDAAGAHVAADRALALAPNDARTVLIRGIAALLLDEVPDGSVPTATVAEVFTHEPKFATFATLAGPLALALDHKPSATGRSALLSVLGRLDTAMATAPPLLLALALENAMTGSAGDTVELRVILSATAHARAYAPADHDALRRIAVAVAHFDAERARELAQRYAALSARGFCAPVPLLWPRRTAGGRLRVIVLRAPESGADTATQLAINALPLAAIELTVATVGAPAGAVAEGIASIALPAQPNATIAKALAAREPDVLVDLAGLMAATGPLLAQRPARAIWTIDSLALPNVAPLVDRTFGTADELAAALIVEAGSLDAKGQCVLDATAMAEAWAEAVRAHQRGDRIVALERYARVLDLQPGHPPALYLSGIANRDEGDANAAQSALADAVAVAPGYVQARLAAARLSLASNRADASVALCEEGLVRSPEDAAIWRMLGLAQLARADGAAAAAAFERALALHPTDGETHYNHGVALQTQRKSADAASAYGRALMFRPDLLHAEFNLAVLAQERGATNAAIAAYEQVLTSDPKNAAAYKNLGEVLQGAGRFDAWLANFLRFEAACPNSLLLAVQALEVSQRTGDFARLQRYLDGLHDETFTVANETELVDCLEEILQLLLYFDVAPALLHRYAHMYDLAARRVYGNPLASPASRKPGRLRIGYLSADLRNHVMGKMIWSAVEHQDKTRFELHFYSLSSQSDVWTEKFRRLADHFEAITDVDERAAAERIAAADLDILVDLSTHTKGARPGILALKPARVQITHVASAGTLGLTTVDFKLTDHHADLSEMQPFQLEPLLPMDGCVYPYRHIPPAAEHPYHRAALRIAPDAVVIGAFVNALKLSRRCLALWREVLARIPRAMLAFSPTDPAFRVQYERLAAAAGIAADRLVFLPQGRGDAENQARYELVDFVLDPMPYGGANSTLEALDMGVPVVTLVGRRHGERTSYSMLANLGVLTTVAQDNREYIDIAVRLAEDTAFRMEVRDAIRAGIARSRLTDLPAHARSLESAYLYAVQQKAPEALAAAV